VGDFAQHHYISWFHLGLRVEYTIINSLKDITLLKLERVFLHDSFNEFLKGR